MASKLFALDIGTRSVVGIILEEHDEKFHVVDLIAEEHKERAMVDGQIHNVIHVASVIQHIKEQLEEKHGPLHSVSVAAAGRALKTEKAAATLDIKNRPVMTEDDISRLELAAVQKAQRQLLDHKEKSHSSHYYCVGYSVLYYRLDGEEIGSLMDQQGEEAEVEVIATFLPRVVVESLLAALKRAGLEMAGLTLEPIAAINALIPSTMRRLNIALVDIGAGTSDIAITNAGTVVAYGMVPTAGDEITEALCDHYLLDFPVAEKVKRDMSQYDEIAIADILGFEQVYTKDEVMDVLRPAVSSLAKAIGNEILQLNSHVAPKAVLLVGGGSLTPDITDELCKTLEIPKNRAAVRGIDAIQKLTHEDHIPISPELVTPIGIAIAAKISPIKYMSVQVNQQIIRLFELKEMTVADALLAANVNVNRLYGKPGLAISITVNGQDIFVPGGHGNPTEIFVNGEKVSTKHPIQNGDVIELVEGADGEPAKATVQDMIESEEKYTIYINDESFIIEPKIRLNGQPAELTVPLKDGDVLTMETAQTVEQILKWAGRENILRQLKPFSIIKNGTTIELPEFSHKILVNDQPTKLYFQVKNGDHINIQEAKHPTIHAIAEHFNMLLENRILVTFQNEQLELKKPCYRIFVNGQSVKDTAVIHSGDNIEFSAMEASNFIYQDVFLFSNWQIPTNFKGTFKILRNGEPSHFDAEIFGGDQLTIHLVPTSVTP
ncbi:rod shape-determining protein [Rummeliibacillus suwonensis]|uniref:rod shape-determining protein n=1 Tax=Rummeliibacillus suwonensis TaxID=1306154 RepID=UPI00289F5E98|nr:rod shape-determining protein [Rummeliibacillus suwonensis]